MIVKVKIMEFQKKKKNLLSLKKLLQIKNAQAFKTLFYYEFFQYI